MSYQTAWLKAHYPAPFMAAVLSADMHNTDKVGDLIEECRSMKLRIDAPDVNASEFKFTVNEKAGSFTAWARSRASAKARWRRSPKRVRTDRLRTCSISARGLT